MAEVLKLTGARVALSGTHAERMDLSIRRGRFLPFDNHAPADSEYDLSGHLLLPGLINAHDHLEFALFPRLGRGPWPNASEWASEIYHPERSPVKEHLSVPKAVRLAWGGIRNLVSGVTTVSHHNPWEPEVFNRSFPVRVPRRFGWAHSLKFSSDVPDRFRNTPARWPFIIHAAEGSDDRSRGEITRLDEMGALTRRTVLVHAAGAGPAELALIRKRGASIVWCPSSNLFTLGRTLKFSATDSELLVTLGTDSALTAKGDLMDEIGVARKEAGLSAAEIYPFVTTSAARVLRLNDGQGAIRERGVADLVAVPDTGGSPAEALAGLRPELVMTGGRCMLVSPRLISTRLAGRFATPDFHPIRVEGRGHFLVRADIPYLYRIATRTLGPELKLAGKRVCP